MESLSTHILPIIIKKLIDKVELYQKGETDRDHYIELFELLRPNENKSLKMAVFGSGTYTWKVPSGIKNVIAKVWGAGGGTIVPPSGLGIEVTGIGAGGGYIETTLMITSPEIHITVGKGGAYNSNPNGGSSIINYDSTSIIAGGGRSSAVTNANGGSCYGNNIPSALLLSGQNSTIGAYRSGGNSGIGTGGNSPGDIPTNIGGGAGINGENGGDGLVIIWY